MDIQMPVMNGYEATKAIRAMPGCENLPIIAVSANAFEEDRRASLEAGMNDHVAKPIDVAVLMRTLAKYLK
jgi:FOG: CheY-like receiver